MPKRSKKYIPGAKRYNVFREMIKANYGGYFQEVTARLLRECFESIDEAAEYFGVARSSVYRWQQSGHWPVMALRLLLIIHRGYLPTTNDWAGCCIVKERGTNPKREPVHLLYIPGFREGFRPDDVRWHLMLKSRYDELIEKERNAQESEQKAVETRQQFKVISGGKLWKK